MELTGDVLIGAERSRVWAALNDPDVLTACIPGCEAVELVSPTEKTARMMVKVGPVRARFSGRIVMSDVIEAEQCAMSFEGSGGAAGMARGRSQVELRDEGSSTRLRYTVQASVAGKLGQVGGRMIDAAAKQMADQFFNAFHAQLLPATSDSGELQTPSDASSGTDASALAQGPESADLMGMTSGEILHRRVQTSPDSTEWLRIKWFALGVLATTVGVLLGSRL